MLSARGSFNVENIPRFIRADPDPDVLQIDLSATTFVEPTGLVTIAALADQASRENRSIDFTPPGDYGVRNYLSRMGVKHHLDGLFTEHGLPDVASNPHPEELLELQKFATEFDGEQLAQLLYDKVSGHTDAQIPETLYTSICELAANATTHAQVPHGFAAAQTFWQGGWERIVFAVADSGIGIQQSLAKHYQLADAREALQEAVKYGTSGTGEAGRGSGLHDVMDAVVGLQGRFTIISGNAKLVATSDNNEVKVFATPSAYPGTLIEGQLSCRP
jgi:hypothetical protein